MKIFVLAAALRRDSLNKKLAIVATELLTKQGVNVDPATLNDFELPHYNGDLDGDEKPSAAIDFKKRLEQSDGLVLVSPEYNGSMPGPVKNLIDWVSRFRPMPWEGCKVGLLSASPSVAGGSRGLAQLRIPLQECGAFVLPQTFSLSNAHQAFDDDGGLVDEQKAARLEATLSAFVKMATALQ